MKDNIMQALNMTWKGMLAVFLVMAVLFLIILLMNKLTRYFAQKRAARRAPPDRLPEDSLPH